MNRLTEIQDQYIKYINDSTYVYKSCGDWIVVLQKLIDTITNESREVADTNHAKFRANKLLVVDIINKFEESKKINNVCNTVYTKNSIIYGIGNIVSIDDFENDISIVCAKGIHYFKTIETAFYYEYNGYIEKYYSWHDNGNKSGEYNYSNEYEYCKKTLWYENGQKFSECNYVNQTINGNWICWHENGNKCSEGNYVNGFKCGVWIDWNEDGTKISEYFYVNGSKCDE